MKTQQDIITDYVKLDLELMNDVHRRIQELLRHEQIIEDRKKKINKLKRRIWIQNGM